MVDTTAAQRANFLKAKVRRILADIDQSKPWFHFQDKSGFVKERLFYDMLGYNGISVEERERAFIRKKTGKSDRLNYREALAMLYIRVESSNPLTEQVQVTPLYLGLRLLSLIKIRPWVVRDKKPLEVHLGKGLQSKRSNKIPLQELMRNTVTGENAFTEVRRSINYFPPRQGTSMSRSSADNLEFPQRGGSRISNDALDDPIGSIQNPIESVEQIDLERRLQMLNLTSIKEKKPKRKPKALSPLPPHTAQEQIGKLSPTKASISPTRSPRAHRAQLEKLYKSVEVAPKQRDDASSLSQDGNGQAFGSMARRKTSKIKDQFFHDPEANYNIISNQRQNFDDKEQYKNPEAKRMNYDFARPAPPKGFYKQDRTGDLMKFSGSTHKHIPDFLRGLYSNPVADAETIKLIKRMIEVHVDNRQLNNIRMGFLKLDSGNRGLLNLYEFEKKLVKVFLNNCPLDLQDIFTNLVKHPENQTLVSYDRVSAFIDLFQYFPYVIKRDKNFSEDVYFALSSNKVGKAFFDWNELKKFSDGETELQTLLDYFWLKIQTKFTQTSQAFRFFDLNSDGQISFNEFCVGLQNLNMKLSKENALKIFKYIDTNHSNDISYFEFCELCEERRRAIDPFELKQAHLASLYEKKRSKARAVPETAPIISAQLQNFKKQRQKKLPDSLNPNSFTFGRKTQEKSAEMAQILNNEYQAQWLEEQLAKEGEYLASEQGSHISGQLSNGSKKLRVFKNFHTKASKQMQDTQLKKFKEKEKTLEQDKLKMYFRTPRLKNLSLDNSSLYSLGGGISEIGKSKHQHECENAYALPAVPGSKKGNELKAPKMEHLVTQQKKMPPLLKDEQKSIALRNASAMNTPHERRMKSLVREIYTPSPLTVGHKKQTSLDIFRRTGAFNDKLKRRLEDQSSDKKIDPRELFRHKQSPLVESLDKEDNRSFSRFIGKRNSGQMSQTSTSFHKTSFVS